MNGDVLLHSLAAVESAILHVTPCEMGWILIGCQCCIAESDPNDIVCRCYSCGVDSTIHLSYNHF